MGLIEYIIRFERHLKGALNLKYKDVSDYLIYNTLAMECFQAVNSLIGIAQYIVTKKRLGFPSTYGSFSNCLRKKDTLVKRSLNVSKDSYFLEIS